MQERLVAEADLGLTQILGLIALIAAFLTWRIADVQKLKQQQKLLLEDLRSGYAEEWVRDAWYKGWLEGTLRLIAIVGCVWFFYETYHYLGHVNVLVRDSLVLDLDVFDRMRRHAETVKSEAIVLAFVATIVILADWLVGLLWTPGEIHQKDIPELAHANVVPPEWSDAQTVLWDDRIARAVESLAEIPDLAGKVGLSDSPTREELDQLREEWQHEFHDHWPVWSRCVVAYQATCDQEQQRTADSGRAAAPVGGNVSSAA